MPNPKLKQIVDLIKSAEGVTIGALVDQINRIIKDNNDVRSKFDVVVSLFQELRSNVETYTNDTDTKLVNNLKKIEEYASTIASLPAYTDTKVLGLKKELTAKIDTTLEDIRSELVSFFENNVDSIKSLIEEKTNIETIKKGIEEVKLPISAIADIESYVKSFSTDYSETFEDLRNSIKVVDNKIYKVPAGVEVFDNGRNLGRFPSINFIGGTVTPRAGIVEVSLGAGGGSQDLQSVTDVGNTTTNPIEVTTSLTINGNPLGGESGYLILFDVARDDFSRLSAYDSGISYDIGGSGVLVPKLDFSTQTASNVFTFPDASGTLALSVNGNTADSAGNITITTSPITIENGNSLFSTGLTGTGSGSTATSSIFFGDNSGNNATNASLSNFFGDNAGASATNAFFSNFIGGSAGSGATNAANSVFIGLASGLGDTVNNTVLINDSDYNWSILIGPYTNTGGFQGSVLLGGGFESAPIANTAANQFMLADTITKARWRGIEYEFPAAQAAASGYVLSNNGSGVLSWVAPSSGGTPGGSNTQLQYNNAGAFGGISGATTNGTAVTFGAGNLLVSDITASGSGGIALKNSGGTSIISLGSGGGVNASIAAPTNMGTDQTDYVQIAGGTGTTTFTATGGSSNINISLVPKGTGVNNLNGFTTITAPTLTGSSTTAALAISQTWNTTGIVNGITYDVTNTASNSSSRLINLTIGGSNRFGVRTDSAILMGSGTNILIGAATVTTGNVAANGTGIVIASGAGSNGGFGLWVNQNSTRTFTSGTGGATTFTGTFAPTSGTGVYNHLNIDPTINQTGGANGITRGIYINPTLTAAADFRGIDLAQTSGTAINQSGTGAINSFFGDMRFDKTITASGTTGAQTINKNAGSVNFAASATSLVVTNSRVTTSSVIVATVATNDTTMTSVQAVAGSGSFTLYPNAAPTAETRVNFIIIN